jgi:hypothetical protein
LGRRRARGLGSLAEAISKRCTVFGSAVVRLANDGREVEVELAEIGPGDNAISSAIQGIAGGDSFVNNQVQCTVGRVVVLNNLDDGREQMLL